MPKETNYKQKNYILVDSNDKIIEKFHLKLTALEMKRKLQKIHGKLKLVDIKIKEGEKCL